jgi:hypothetical protein|nr:MAG TPA: hypothetical protein [Caudoviricetes sp.]
MYENNENKHPLDDVTMENYNVPKGEEGIYHVVLEVKEFDKNTGERKSTPTMQKFGVVAFETSLSQLRHLGYNVRVVYDPTQYLKNKQEAEAQAQAQAQEEAEAQRVEQALEEQRKQHEQELEEQRKALEAEKEEAIKKAVAEELAKQGKGEEQEKPEKQEKQEKPKK